MNMPQQELLSYTISQTWHMDQVLEDFKQLGCQQSPRTPVNNSNRKDNLLEPKGNEQWNKATLLLHNEYTTARTTVLYHFANVVYG